MLTIIFYCTQYENSPASFHAINNEMRLFACFDIRESELCAWTFIRCDCSSRSCCIRDNIVLLVTVWGAPVHTPDTIIKCCAIITLITTPLTQKHETSNQTLVQHWPNIGCRILWSLVTYHDRKLLFSIEYLMPFLFLVPWFSRDQ